MLPTTPEALLTRTGQRIDRTPTHLKNHTHSMAVRPADPLVKAFSIFRTFVNSTSRSKRTPWR